MEDIFKIFDDKEKNKLNEKNAHDMVKKMVKLLRRIYNTGEGFKEHDEIKELLKIEDD